MRGWTFGLLGLGAAGLMTISVLHGQDRPAAPATSTAVPMTPLEAPDTRDLAKLSPLQRQMHLSAQRGADWLFRANGVKGRFLDGFVPALKVELDGAHFYRQAGAAFALARAARYLGEDRYAARATQSILALLEETITDPNDPQVRHTELPSILVNRLGTAGLLVAAIHELPAPQADLLDRAEQLCNYIRRQARTDGSLACGDATVNGQGADDGEAIQRFPGIALYALLRSQRQRPASWKIEVVRKALGYYRPWWKEHKGLEFVTWQSAAWTEAFLLTKEQACAEFVFEMNDWLCTLQYERIDPKRLQWHGGFMSWTDGRKVETAPTVGAAKYTEALAEACRSARAAGEVGRFPRYSGAVERSLQFLATLQYTDANTQHFADWYRPRLVGAFHASHQEGDLRIDYTQHAVSALVLYLASAAQ